MKKNIGILLLHGFTGSPNSMAWLAKEFEKHSYITSSPRLCGHGTKPTDMLNCTYANWLTDVEMAYTNLQKKCDSIILVGLSMGGALALCLAAKHKVDGVVTMAVPYCIRFRTRLFATLLYRLVKFQYKVNGPDINDKDALKWMNSYNYYPTRASLEVFKVLKKMRVNIKYISSPVMVLHGSKDHVVEPGNADLIYNALQTPTKTKKLYDRSFHILSLDYDKELVLRDILQFIEGITKKLIYEKTELPPS
ncbi:MAG: alpha/beta fold hydrolase [Deferribacteres bacterium]|nr:alpha/beta fold hydrolase [candidate division KSB1 bacterium]MCB9501777.1 alpha/beta fold hydrolase [Deferribacteres bacterium]